MDMLMHVYFNDQVPENHNVRLKSIKNMFVEVFKDPNWITRDLQETVDKMISDSRIYIMNDIDPTDISKNIEMLCIANDMANIPSTKMKKLRNCVKARLDQRRKVGIS